MSAHLALQEVKDFVGVRLELGAEESHVYPSMVGKVAVEERFLVLVNRSLLGSRGDLRVANP